MLRSASVLASWRLVQVRRPPSSSRRAETPRSARPASGAGPLRKGRRAAGVESAEQVADGLGVVVEVGGEPRGRPAGVGEGDHRDAVADPGRQVGAPEITEFVTGGVVEHGADHAE